MQITKQEIKIMKFLNECGFCTMRQIKNKFNLSKTHAYRLLKRLRNVGLVKYKRVMYESPGVYFLSSKGAEYSELPCIDGISAGKFEHQIIANDVFIKLIKNYPEANWISERQLNREKFRNGLGKRGHISDGILQFADGKKIAIEVELSVKGKDRIEKILKMYRAQIEYKEVWYFCAPSVINALKSLSEKMPFVKIHNLEDFLA